MLRYMVYIDTIHQSKKKKKLARNTMTNAPSLKKIAKVVIFMQT